MGRRIDPSWGGPIEPVLQDWCNYPVCGMMHIKEPLLLIVKEGIVLFNDALNTFYLRLYGVEHIVKGNLDSEKENNPLPPLHWLLFD